jgi:hypothetical protein
MGCMKTIRIWVLYQFCYCFWPRDSGAVKLTRLKSVKKLFNVRLDRDEVDLGVVRGGALPQIPETEGKTKAARRQRGPDAGPGASLANCFFSSRTDGGDKLECFTNDKCLG